MSYYHLVISSPAYCLQDVKALSAASKKEATALVKCVEGLGSSLRDMRPCVPPTPPDLAPLTRAVDGLRAEQEAFMAEVRALLASMAAAPQPGNGNAILRCGARCIFVMNVMIFSQAPL